MKNEMELRFSALSENEAFARVAVGSFIAKLDPTLDELTEIKTVISEAVTNAIIHGYNYDPLGEIMIQMVIEEDMVELVIRDEGIGIADIEEACEPLFTTKPELERSGMGFTIMENFTDEFRVISEPLIGTTIYMKKIISNKKALCN